MSQRGFHRQILLFLLAVIVPSLVLIVLSVRMIGQERELAEKRLLEEQRRLVSEIRQELLARLERIKLQEMRTLATSTEQSATISDENSEIVFTAWIEDGRLVLPWESDKTNIESQTLLNEGSYASTIHQGEDAELTAKQFAKAAALYREAARLARHPVQAAYVQLLLARALTKSGAQSEAETLYRKLLASPSEIKDEQGVPFALYAAARLFERGVRDQALLDRIRAEAYAQGWPSPTASYLLCELTGKFVETSTDLQIVAPAKEMQQRCAETTRRLEQALALQKDFPNLKLIQVAGHQSRNPEPVWMPYGEEIWLLSLIPPLAEERRSVLVAVHAENVFASLDLAKMAANDSFSQINFVTGGETAGDPLGENFPGLKVAFSLKADHELARRWYLQRAFYVAALLLVLGVTLFGAYLFWRDLRRELRLAELRSQFVSSVSHELKTPLTAIRMFAETLLMRRAADREAQTEYLSTIVSESERLTRLLNNVLDFSKIEQGRKTYHFEPTSLAEVVHTSAKALEYPLRQESFKLRLNLEDDLPTVPADGDAIEQAVLNLLTNAMKYSGESREIDLNLRKRNGHAVIEVTDRGLGIAPEEQARIFDKFYRAPSLGDKLIAGTGLGLTLVAHIAQAHGGRVEVESAPGRGSTFSIHLPLESPTNFSLS